MTATSLHAAMLESPQVDACAADECSSPPDAGDDGAPPPQQQLVPARVAASASEAPHSAPLPHSGSRFEAALLLPSPALRQLAAVGARGASAMAAGGAADEIFVGSWVRRHKLD